MTDADIERRTRGRPRVHPDGTTASDRARLMEARRRAAGRRRVCIWITETEQVALDSLVARHGDVRDAIGLALLEAAQLRRSVE